jgi:uncharacterized protein
MGPEGGTANGQAPSPALSELRIVELAAIEVELPAPFAVVVLAEAEPPRRRLSIPVGLPEGSALAQAWRRVDTPRPLTHELFSYVLTKLGGTIEVVRLLGRLGGVVFAEFELSGPRGREVVPCRPSDGITLALRQGVVPPILADARLFEREGDVEWRPLPTAGPAPDAAPEGAAGSAGAGEGPLPGLGEP